MHDPKRSDEVGGRELLEHGGPRLGQRSERHHARGVDQAVDSAERRDRYGNSVRSVVRSGEVDDRRRHIWSQLAGADTQPFRVAAGEHHAGAPALELVGDQPAKHAGAAQHEHAGVGNRHLSHGRLLPVSPGDLWSRTRR